MLRLGWIVVGVAAALALRVVYRFRQPEHTHGRSRLLWASQRESVPERTFIERIVDWVKEYIEYRSRPKRDVDDYPSDDFGVYGLSAIDGGGTVRLACTGDFGKGPKSRAGAVAAAMEMAKFEFTVHLGDIYPVGRSEDVQRNFLGKDRGGVSWPEGVVGTLALPGNHEYQSGGAAFFDEVLPAMQVVNRGRKEPQKTSFFCLENDQWRVIGLDTGNQSVQQFGLEFIYYALNKIPLLKRLSWVQDLKTWLPETEMAWLKNVLASETKNPKGLIFMSHHQVYTALDARGGNPKPGKQVASLLPDGREAIWFHGHGHIQATYAMQRIDGAENFRVAARAIGIGSDVDPVNLSRLKKKICTYQLEYVDNRGRLKAKKGDIKSPHNGYAVLTFQGRKLEIEYFTLKADSEQVERVLSEKWTADRGVLNGPDYGASLDDEDFITPAWIEDNIKCSGSTR